MHVHVHNLHAPSSSLWIQHMTVAHVQAQAAFAAHVHVIAIHIASSS
jgi:hypothetical protein